MATHFSILAWKIPWTEESGGVQFMGRKESDTTEHMGYMLSLWNKMGFFLYHFNEKTNIFYFGKHLNNLFMGFKERLCHSSWLEAGQ